MGSRDQGANNDSMGANNHTYRSENAKNWEVGAAGNPGPTNAGNQLVFNKNKIQKKLNTLLT